MRQSEISRKLLPWFNKYGRKDLPWQVNKSPYSIWVSEVMLQQTQVSTVIPYFKRFIKDFPTVEALGFAELDDVLFHWSGLGYYARARNMHKAANLICSLHNGSFPHDIAGLTALPGIGRSTAGAILSLSGRGGYPILDGNVKRVLARYYSVAGWPGQSAVASELWGLAEKNVPDIGFSEYTQAIMDLGATLCTRINPSCNFCPIKDNCQAYRNDEVKMYPEPKPKMSKAKKYVNVLFIESHSEVYLEKRPNKGIWGGLYSFPEVESPKDSFGWIENKLNTKVRKFLPLPSFKHSFTHFDLIIKPFGICLCDSSNIYSLNDDGIWYSTKTNKKIGVAAPINKLIKNYNLHGDI